MAQVRARVRMYATDWCPYCARAESLLRSKGVAEFDKIRVEEQPRLMQEMLQQTGRRTVPQIYIGEVHVGGYDELAALERAGRLDGLLAG